MPNCGPRDLVQKNQLHLVSQNFVLDQTRKTLVICYCFSSLSQKKILAHQRELFFLDQIYRALSPVHLVQKKQLHLVSQIFCLDQSRKTLEILHCFSSLIQKKTLAPPGELEFSSSSSQKNNSKILMFFQFDVEQNSSSPGGASFSRTDILGSDSQRSSLSGISVGSYSQFSPNTT